MKCISLSPPYATLVAIGTKKIETRGRATSYRGPLAIHQAKSLRYVGGKQGLFRLCSVDPFASALRAFHPLAPSYPEAWLPFGAIVATCELLDCVETWPRWATITPWLTASWNDTTYHVPPGEGSYERAFGDYTPGRYAWLLGNIKALPTPIPCVGRQWLWDYAGAL